MMTLSSMKAILSRLAWTSAAPVTDSLSTGNRRSPLLSMVAAAVLAVSFGTVPAVAQLSTGQAQALAVIGPISPDHGFP